jgi:uncharacterized protein
MTEEEVITYPTIGQSWGIVGISMLAMIFFSPLSLLLNNIAGKEMSFLVFYLFAMGATFWFAHQKRKNRTSIRGYDLDFSSAKIILLVSMAAIAIQTGIISPIINLIPMPESIKEIFLEFARRNGIYSFIAIVIAAPILEELIFRGIILNGLLKKYSPLKSILISSILFGVIHLNPWQFIGAFVIGVFSGWVYYKTRKLTLSILIHFANNLFAFASMYFMDAETMMNSSLTQIYGGSFNLIAITSGAIIVALVCLYLLRFEFKHIEMNYAGTQGQI